MWGSFDDKAVDGLNGMALGAVLGLRSDGFVGVSNADRTPPIKLGFRPWVGM